MELQKAKATLASYKSHFSRQKKSFDRRLDEFKNHPDVEENWSMLKDAFNKYQKGFDKIEGAFNDVDLENEIDRLHCRCLVDAHRFREAHRLLCTFTDEHPDDIDAWIDLSLVCREVGDHNRMRKAATRVASLDRGRFEGHFLLGCSFMDEAL